METWTPVPDGEYNEQTLMTSAGLITLSSDRDGEQWSYTIGNGEPVRLEATDLYAARREVLRDLKG